MANGATIDLLLRGPHDEKFTPSTTTPQVTVFEPRTYTYEAFKFQEVEITATGTTAFGAKVSYEIPKTGDGLSNACLEATVTAMTVTTGRVGWINMLGIYLIKEKKFKIGSTEIERCYSYYTDIWERLTCPSGQEKGVKEMMKDVVYYDYPGIGGDFYHTVHDSPQARTTSVAAFTMLIPLNFYFCRHWGLMFPICATSFNKINIDIEYEALTNLVMYYDGATALSVTPTLSTKLWIEYVFFEKATRTRYINNEMSQVITTIQDNGSDGITVNSSTARVTFTFNFPVIELMWAVQETAARSANLWWHYDQYSGISNPYLPQAQITSSQLWFGGSERQVARNQLYHTRQHLQKRHTNIPWTTRGWNFFIWSINPESPYPVGFANFTRIQNPELRLTLANIDTTKTAQFLLVARALQILTFKDGYVARTFAS